MGLRSWIATKLIKFAIGGKTMNWLEGKKTYIVMGITIILGLIESWNGYCAGLVEPMKWCVNINIPEIVFVILGALGIYTRAVAKPK